MVWIHGGGNRGGAGGGTVESHITDGGIVLVSIQYRLGALGSCRTPRCRRDHRDAGRPARVGDRRAVRALSVATIVTAQEDVDGHVLRETPAAALAAGRVAAGPTIIGVNAMEFAGYDGVDPAPVIAREFPATVPRVRDAYGLTGATVPPVDPRPGSIGRQLRTDLVFRCPTIAVSRARANRGSRVWQYQFDYARAGGRVSHGSEIGYVFDRPRWPRYDPVGRHYLAFKQGGLVSRTDLRGTICAGRDVP